MKSLKLIISLAMSSSLANTNASSLNQKESTSFSNILSQESQSSMQQEQIKQMYMDNNFWSLDPPMISIDGDDYDFGEDDETFFAQTE